MQSTSSSRNSAMQRLKKHVSELKLKRKSSISRRRDDMFMVLNRILPNQVKASKVGRGQQLRLRTRQRRRCLPYLRRKQRQKPRRHQRIMLCIHRGRQERKLKKLKRIWQLLNLPARRSFSIELGKQCSRPVCRSLQVIPAYAIAARSPGGVCTW